MLDTRFVADLITFIEPNRQLFGQWDPYGI